MKSWGLPALRLQLNFGHLAVGVSPLCLVSLHHRRPNQPNLAGTLIENSSSRPLSRFTCSIADVWNHAATTGDAHIA